jgi:hypothetical protein
VHYVQPIVDFLYRHFSPGMLTVILAVLAAVTALPKVVKKLDPEKGSWWAHGAAILIFCLIAAAEMAVINHADKVSEEHFGTLLGHFQEQGKVSADNLDATNSLSSYLHQRSSVKTKIEPFTKPSLKQRALELSAAILQHLASREFFARTPVSNSQSFEHDASIWVAYDRQTVEEYKEKFEPAVRKIRDEFAAQQFTDRYLQQFTNMDAPNVTAVRLIAEGIGNLAKKLKD